MLRAFGHAVATCCDMLGVVGSNLTIFKYTQHVATRCNKVGKLFVYKKKKSFIAVDISSNLCGISGVKVWDHLIKGSQISTETMGIISGGGCMHGNVVSKKLKTKRK